MEKDLRNFIENDIDNILDNNQIKKKNFFFLILHYLLENETINLKEVENISEELQNEYDKYIEELEIELAESNGEIIKVLKGAVNNFRNRISPILKKIDGLKNGYSTHNTR